MKSFPTIPFIAIIFIITGLDFLLDRLGYLYSDWTQLAGAILLVQGLLMVIYGIRDQQNGKTIFAIILSVVGLGLLFHLQIDRYYFWQIRYYAEDYWPVLLIIAGIWLIIRSIRHHPSRPNEWGRL